MSTVPEVLAAREQGLNVMVLSLATNFVVIPETYRSIREEVRAEVRSSPFVQLALILNKKIKNLKLANKSVELQVEKIVSHEEVLIVGKEKAVVLMDLIQKIVSMM